MAIDDLVLLENKIEKEYRKASKELKARWDEYINGYDEIVDGKQVHHQGYAERWEQEHKAMEERKGNYANVPDPEAHFQQWELNQIGRGDHWLEMKDQMVSRISETNQIASGYINNELPKAYVKESNSIASLAEKSAMEQGIMGIRFDLVDESTIRNLMTEKDNVISFKTTKVNPKRDYEWNDKKIQNALTQGILQGDSITRLANRFLAVMKSNESAAIRNARTSMTSARNAGKQDRFDDLAEKGCEITKIWVATHDERVRDWHIEADGQEVPYDEPFIVGDDEMMYPCDPSASPANVYNCRCTMKTGKIVFKSILDDNARLNANIMVDNGKMSEPFFWNKSASYGEAVESLSNEHQDNIRQYIEKADNDVRGAWEEASSQLQAPLFDSKDGTAYYDSGDKRVHFIDPNHAYAENDIHVAYKTYFHEYGHNIDYVLGEISIKDNRLADSIIDEAIENIAKSVPMDKYYNMISNIQDTEIGIGMEMYVRDIIRNNHPETWKEIRSEFRQKSDDESYLRKMFETYASPVDLFEDMKKSQESMEIVNAFCDNVINLYTKKELSDISDMYEAVCVEYAYKTYPFGVGHGADYYKKFDYNSNQYVIDKKSVANETFAEMYASSMCDPNSLKVIKEHFPKSYGIFKEMLKESIK